MGYISKDLVLKSYLTLSSLTEDHKQGQTQIVSAIRHFVAFDMFFKQRNANCDLNKSTEKNLFVDSVRKLVNIKDIDYTTNFYTTIKPIDDCGVGSNFTSQGVVNKSKQNSSKLYVYPTRGNRPLFDVKDSVIIRNLSYYQNIKHYLSSEKIRAAFVVWVLRNENLMDLSLSSIKRKLQTILTAELVENIMPKDETLLSFIDGSSLVEGRYQTEKSDILAIFNDHNEAPTNGNKYRPYITAIKSKPFLLLAGISGTGKSRIVRELARACWDVNSNQYKSQKPRNFEMIQVKPNWHDSSELIGYVSRVSEVPVFVAGDFLRFIAHAWEEPDVPYFLCLDEMNLAPVEQYFAEYLSAVESRKADSEGLVTSDPILKKSEEDWYRVLTSILTSNDDIRRKFLDEGICIPQNLIVIGTVNMDETTFSFSRKVLDRAMTIEMNDVNLDSGLTERYEKIGKLGAEELIGNAVEGVDVYELHKNACNIVIAYLKQINAKLEGTPFKIAYRTRNEFLLYVVNNLPYNKDDNGHDIPVNFVIARAVDEITSMKILSRIEGDETKVSKAFLGDLSSTIKDQLNCIYENFTDNNKSVSIAKLTEMSTRLESGYTSFWS